MDEKLGEVGTMMLDDALDVLDMLEREVNESEEYSEKFKKNFNEIVEKLVQLRGE